MTCGSGGVEIWDGPGSRLPAPSSRENIWIVARRFVQQRGEGSRLIGCGQPQGQREHDEPASKVFIGVHALRKRIG